MKTIIINLFICLTGMLLHGQKLLVKPPVVPFEPISFSNVNPSWVMDIYDSTYIKLDTFDGRNVFDFLYTVGDFIHAGKLYRCHNIRRYDLMGFRVSCIDIDSGQLLWAKNIDYEEYSRQHLALYQTFDEAGHLVIIGFRKLYPYDPKEDSWYSGAGAKKPSKIFRLTLDGSDGRVIGYHSPDSNPDYNVAIDVNTEKWNFFGVDTNNRVEFLYTKINEIPVRSALVQKGYIEVDGIISISDSLVYSPSNWKTIRTRYAKKDGKYYCLERSSKDEPKYIVEMDAQLQELNRIDISHFKIVPYYIELIYSSDEYMIYGQAFPSTFNYNLRYFICDYKGNLVNTVDLKDDLYKKYSDVKLTFDKKYGKFLLIGFGNEYTEDKKEIKSYLDVMHYDGKEYEFYKRMELSKTNRVFEPYEVIQVDDDRFIFDMVAGTYYYDESNLPNIKYSIGNKTTALMSISRKELGLLSSLENERLTAPEYYSYPNPSTGAFNIYLETIEGRKDIRLFTADGRNVYVETGLEQEYINLDLSGLPSGTYIYKIFQKNKELASGEWIKL